jgi:hypothetical protein
LETRFDIVELRKKYSASWHEAVANRRFILSYHIEQWSDKLNEVERRTYHDIRALGLQLYPMFPVSDDQYLHFANPFKMVGIEIVYKNSPAFLIERKTRLLEGLGWKIYLINSENTYHTIEEFFRIKRKDKALEWEELDGELASLFAEKYHTKNASCLLYYLQQKYFQRVEV